MKNLMWITLLITAVTILSLDVRASEFKCGEYEFTGVIKKFEGKNALKLYDGTMSEITLTLAPDLEEAVSIYENKAVWLKGRLFAPVKDTRGHVESLLSAEEVQKLMGPDQPYTARFLRADIKERVPDPLHPDLDSGMSLVKETPCEGSRAPSAKKKSKPGK